MKCCQKSSWRLNQSLIHSGHHLLGPPDWEASSPYLPCPCPSWELASCCLETIISPVCKAPTTIPPKCTQWQWVAITLNCQLLKPKAPHHCMVRWLILHLLLPFSWLPSPAAGPSSASMFSGWLSGLTVSHWGPNSNSVYLIILHFKSLEYHHSSIIWNRHLSKH